jgi:tetratricopeptide (TPR) repeat protein
MGGRNPIERLLRPPERPAKLAAEFRATGHAQFQQRRYEDAAGSYSAAAAAEPDQTAVHFDLAVCLAKAEEWRAAANSFRRVLEDNPGHAEALAGLGSCLLHLDAAEEALRCGMFFVNQRWLGGLLTNFATIQKSIKRLRELDTMATDGRYELLPKKEVTRLERERKSLEKNLSGIKNMPRLPDAIFVIDSNNEAIASPARRWDFRYSDRGYQLRSRFCDYVIP